MSIKKKLEKLEKQAETHKLKQQGKKKTLDDFYREIEETNGEIMNEIYH